MNSRSRAARPQSRAATSDSPWRQAITLAVAPAGVVAASDTGAASARSPEGEAAAPAVPVESLRVRALGPLSIEVDGATIPLDAWRSARPRELLLYLLCHPEGRTREQIGLVFWPEASTAQVKNNFHVTLHHLRKVLGRADWIVFDEDRYAVNAALGVAFDAARFEGEMASALRAASGDREEALRTALAAYRGDFLEDAGMGDWHLEVRDRLRRLWVEGMHALGEALVATGRHEAGADVFRRLVQREELDERAYRQLMTSLARAGDRAQAVRAYERLAALLLADLEATPDRETEALHQRVRLGQPV